ERFMTTLDCIDVAFISDQTMDQLPLPSRLGKTRVGGVDLNNLRIRTALSAVLALAPHRAPPSRQRGRSSTSTTNSFDSTCSPSSRSSVSQHRQPDCRSIGASAYPVTTSSRRGRR